MNKGCPAVRWYTNAATASWQARFAPALRHIGRHRLRTEPAQGDLHTLPVRRQFLLDPLERVVLEDSSTAGGPHHQQPRRLAPSGQQRQRCDRRRVAPVQVFEHQHHRALGGQYLERLGQLPQHARRGGILPLARSRCPCLRRDSAGRCASQVGAYCRRHTTRRSPSGARPSRPSASSSGRYASPAPYCSMHCPRPSHSASAAASCCTQASTSVVLPTPASPVTQTSWRTPCCAWAKQACQLRRLGRAAQQRRRRGGMGEWRRGGRQRHRRGARGDRRHKAIPQPMHRGDVAGLLRPLPQRLAQGVETPRQHPLADHGVGPHGVEQGRFGHYLSGLAGQPPQDGQRLGRQRHHLGPRHSGPWGPASV